MRKNYKISVTLHTASTDKLLANQGVESHIGWFVDTLNRQTFKDFELVLVDCLYPEKRDVIRNLKANFPIKYVPNVRTYWQDMGYISLSSPKNSAILFSEGELIIQFDDAETFDENLLSIYWDYFQKDLFFHPVHQRPYKGRVSVDHRIEFIKKENKEEYVHNHGSWLYAGTSFSLKDAISLNGFNERLDGQKSLQDCEFGCRLQAMNKKFVTHLLHPIHILDHIEEYNKKYKEIKEKSNYGFILANMKLGVKDWTIKLFNEYTDIIDIDTNERMKNNKYTLTKIWEKCPVINIAKDREMELYKYYDNYYS